MLSNAAECVDVEGKVTDEKTRILIKQLVEALEAWTNRLNSKPI
jgi:hypothetical protein